MGGGVGFGTGASKGQVFAEGKVATKPGGWWPGRGRVSSISSGETLRRTGCVTSFL